MRIAAWIAVSVVMTVVPPTAMTAENSLPTITVWLMPNEPAADEASTSLDAELEAFNALNDELGITVLNAVDPVLVDQLRSPHPDYAMTTWDLIKGQQQTLGALSGFAAAHRVRIHVLFVTWGHVFEDLRSVKDRPHDVRHPPDVAQIGSTWAEYFASHEVLLPPSPPQAGKWKWRRSPALSGPASLYYLTDIRLLYYWKRRIQDPAEQGDFVIDSSSWEAVLDSLRRRVPEYRSPFNVSGMVMPIRRETNLIHRYAMLVNAGGATFFDGDRLDLSSDEALQVPLLLGKHANWQDDDQAYRLLSFPDMSHEEATVHFRDGRYLATIEPMSFLVRWHDGFSATASGATFWDHAGVAVPPAPFKGGSDLMVLRGTPQPALSFALATYLAGSQPYTELLAVHGHLPVQREDFGLATLSQRLGVPAEYDQTFQQTIRGALEQGREHAPSVNFPTEIESADALDGFQTLWRQVMEATGRPDGAKRIEAAARATEFDVNRRIVLADKVVDFLQRYLIPILGACIAVVIGSGSWGFQQRALRNKTRELLTFTEQNADRELEKLRLKAEASAAKLAEEHSRRLIAEERARREEEQRQRLEAEARGDRYQSVATAACTLMDVGHSATHSSNEVERKQRMKLVLVRDHEFAHDTRIKLRTFGDVVTMSLLQAVDSVHTNGVYSAWRDGAFSEGREISPSILNALKGTVLRCDGAMQPTQLAVTLGVPDAHLSLTDTPQATTALAVPCACDAKMLVRVLSCLFENAIQGVFTHGGYMPIRVAARHNAESSRCQISVANDVYATDSGLLLDELCESGPVDDLFQALRQKERLSERVGIGWQFAGMIAHQFFGGLSVEFRRYDPPVVTQAFKAEVPAFGEVTFTVTATAAQQETPDALPDR